MPIAVSCPSCGKRLKAPDEAAGKIVKCPGCGENMALPAPALATPSQKALSPVQAEQRYEPPGPPPLPSRKSGDHRADHDEDENDEPDEPRSGRRRLSRRRREEDDYDDRLLRRVSSTSRTTYIVLGLFLGGLGIHNFVAGRTEIAVAQLVIFLVSIPLMCVGVGFVTIFIPSIWALVEVIAVQHDGIGRRMI